MTHFKEPSSSLPAAFVERGCSVLQPILAAADAEWLRRAAQLLSGESPLPPRFVERLAALLGHEPLLSAAGGIGNLERPEMLAALLLGKAGGTWSYVAAWLLCAFGLELQHLVVERTSIRSAVRIARVTLKGTSPTVDRARVAGFLRQLLPAHISVREAYVTIVTHQEAEDPLWQPQ